jgi:hypothetical protein
LGGVGMVLSMIVGFISGTGFAHVMLRALVFAAVFFGLGIGVWLLITNYLPELLFPEDGKNEPGSRINIVLDDDKTPPDMYRNMDGGEEVGDIGDLLNGTFKPPPDSDSVAELQGIDQMPEDGYTENTSQGGQVSADSPDRLPDLELVTGPLFGGDDGKPEGQGGQFEPERRPAGNKPQALQGDFHPKEIAAGIRTILNEDK